MVSKCANPGCKARFRYLHEGRLFTVPLLSNWDREGASWEQTSCGLEYVWLCSACLSQMDVHIEPGNSPHWSLVFKSTGTREIVK